MSLVIDAVMSAARKTPLRASVSHAGGALTCEDLAREVESLADVLAREAGPVGIALDNGPAWVVSDLAVLAAGKVCVPLPPFFTAAQRGAALADAGASRMIAPGQDHLIGGQGVSLMQTGLSARVLHGGTSKITYTSGSTGTPKGVCLSQGHIEDLAASLVAVLGVEHAGVHLPVLPLGVLLENVAGLYPILLAEGRYHAASLAEVGMGEAFRPDPLRLLTAIRETAATSLILAPELLRGLIVAKRMSGLQTPSLKLVAVGGARVSPTLLADAEAAGLPVVEGYGLSECASVVAMNRPGRAVPGTVGEALPHVRLSIAPDGEVLISSPAFLGYVGAPPRQGPLRTGDIGQLDAAGRLRIDGRKDNLIITGFGRNVSPEWVESELTSEPQILQAMVFGEGQSSLGALIAAMPGAAPDQVEAAVARANVRLPDYAKITRWRQTPPFDPAAGQLTANGRPRRSALVQAYADFVLEAA
ncbi:MAG: AMP-binding protein [Caulobacteraceae bacterium]